MRSNSFDKMSPACVEMKSEMNLKKILTRSLEVTLSFTFREHSQGSRHPVRLELQVVVRLR